MDPVTAHAVVQRSPVAYLSKTIPTAVKKNWAAELVLWLADEFQSPEILFRPACLLYDALQGLAAECIAACVEVHGYAASVRMIVHLVRSLAAIPSESITGKR